MTTETKAGSSLGILGLVYLIFVVYGSLVPLDYHPRPFTETFNAFANIQWLNLDVTSRADWVANLLLYIPLSFLASVWLSVSDRKATARLVATLFAVPFCLALAVGVEFIQLYFPPRTVSLNDLLAESLGSFIGAGLYLFSGQHVSGLWQRWLSGGRHAFGAFAFAYLAAYLALSLFPFDFLVSQAELNEKWSSESVSWLVANSSCEKPALCLVQLIVEMFLVAPMGIFLAHQQKTRRCSMSRVVVLGIGLGIALELLQLFIASSLVQGVSVLTRGAGMALGCFLYQHFTRTGARPAPGWALLLATGCWLLLLIWLNGWMSHSWLSPDQALHRLEEVRFLPFYYHYYTTETQALTSLLSVAGMYAPLGALFWLWLPTRPKAVGLSALIAVLAAGVMESGRLFLDTGHPDPSNLFIAGFAAAAAARLLELGRRWSVRNLIRPNIDQPDGSSMHAAAETGQYSRPAQVVAMLMLIGTALALVGYPLNATLLGTGMAVYAWVLWRNPIRWLFWVPALLPMLNLAPISGRIMFDELDVLMMVTIVVLYLRLPVHKRISSAWLPFGLMAISAVLSLLAGLLPLPPLDANTFTNYQSTFNALRGGKVFLWALLLVVWISRSDLSMQRMLNRFAYGMTLGLLFTVCWVIWERAVYPGLFDFQEDFRVTGPFVEMHTGGGAIEAYLVAAMPFAFLLWRRAATPLVRLLAGLTMILAGYALGVTYARAGYLGMLASVSVLLLGLGWRLLTHLWRGRSALPLTFLVMLVGATSMLPLFLGDYMPIRFSNSARDADIRTAHWRDSLNMMQPDEWILGVGLGSYPGTYYWHNLVGITPSNYVFVQKKNNIWLRLMAGQPLYFEQIIDFKPASAYRLELDARASGGAELVALICEKAMLYSKQCVILKIPASPGWASQHIDFFSGQVGEGVGLEQRVVKLALFAAGGKGIVEVDNLRLQDIGGQDLLRNGDFRFGMDYWNFATDQHLAWHAKNQLLHVMFEQGLLGVAAWTFLIGVAITRLFRQMRQGDMAALALLASLLGMLVVGLFDSVLDVPRLSFLLLMMSTLALAHESRRSLSGKSEAKPDRWTL